MEQLSGESDPKTINVLTDYLVAGKLDVLTQEIGATFSNGDIWPRPTEGYIELFEIIERVKVNNPIEEIII